MTQLLDLQHRFQAFVLGHESTPPPMVAGGSNASAETRLAIYAEAIRLRFLEVLGEDYPGVHAMLGDDGFRTLADAYGQAHPSRQRSIRWFGRHLPAFLRATAPWCDHPMLSEMALFEWSKGELLDAADSSIVGVDDIAAIPAEQWAGIGPTLVPALRRLALEWNVPALWSAVQSGETPPPPARLESAVVWLLWRQGIHIRWRSIDSHEAWALQACADGEDFDFICDGLCERIGEDAAAFRAATYLKQWASDGLLAAV
jgi:GNAT superfamily N-acetyltransferase